MLNMTFTELLTTPVVAGTPEYAIVSTMLVAFYATMFLVSGYYFYKLR